MANSLWAPASPATARLPAAFGLSSRCQRVTPCSRAEAPSLTLLSGRSSWSQCSSTDAGSGCVGSARAVLQRRSRVSRRGPGRGDASPRCSAVHVSAAAASSGAQMEALLFDCDGVLVDTERDGHRVSFNQAFQQEGLPGVEWSVEEYGVLLEIGGGKERMTHYFNKVGWPSAAPADEGVRKDFVAGLHKLKTSLFMDLVDTGALPLRPGVARLIDEALAAGVKVAVCSTSNEKAVSAIVHVMLGPARFSQMQIFAGDVVPRKKPDPAIYNLAATTLGVDPARCVVIEDSHIGLTAAKAAGMTCVVTTSGYTEKEDFAAADVVFPELGDPPAANVDLPFLQSLVTAKAQKGVSATS